MVYVQLEKDWTDQAGVAHAAGASVDVDAATLAQLQADGTVDGGGDVESQGWVGPTNEEPVKAQGWVGPTHEEPAEAQGWVGPTSEPKDTKAQGWVGPTSEPKDPKADGWVGPTAPPAN